MSARRTMALGRGLGLLACAAAAHACGQGFTDLDRMDRANADLVAIEVTLTSGNAGTVQAPIPFNATGGVQFSAHIRALGDDGNPLQDFNGFLAISTSSGELLTLAGANGTNVGGRNVQLNAGEADIVVTITRAIGETRIWAEDQGYEPADPNLGTTPQCSNGVDDDSDGRVDFPADYGCAAPNDDTEVGGSYVLGASDPIMFDTPRISDVQGHATTSPLLNDRILVNHGSLIVTTVNVSGFYVTDTADPMCVGRANCYNSIFLFNFSLPPFIRPCDRLDQLEGTVTEFVSTTQLGNPSWIANPDGEWIDTATSHACPIPEAEPIVAMTLGDSAALEGLESSVVIAQHVTFSPNVGPMLAMPDATAPGGWHFAPGQSNCDFTNDGQIDFHHPMEGPCANACQTVRDCSEWTAWVRFGQIAVDFPADMALPRGADRLIVSPRGALASFDPSSPPVPVGTTVSVTGTLSQVGPNWIITPRCADDIALNDMPLHANASCITPRTDDENNP